MSRSLSALALLLALPVLPARAEEDETEKLRREVRELREQVESQARRIEEISRSSPGLEESIENYLDATASADGAATPPTSGYDGGFFIQDAKGKFLLTISAFGQGRYDWNHRESAPAGEPLDTSGFSLHRIRIVFIGHFTEKFDYHFRFNIDSNGDTAVVVAFGQLNFPDDWNIRAGQILIALGREDWMWALDSLSSDTSANDAAFGAGSSVGVQLNRQWEQRQLWVAFSNGKDGGNTSFTSDEAADWAFSGRLEAQVVGSDWSNWDDLAGRRGRPQGVLWGIAALRSQEARRRHLRPELGRGRLPRVDYRHLAVRADRGRDAVVLQLGRHGAGRLLPHANVAGLRPLGSRLARRPARRPRGVQRAHRRSELVSLRGLEQLQAHG
jgi:hypothetical protein